MKRDLELEQYFSEAASWDMDRTLLLQRSERRAWRVAGAAMLLLALSLAALLALTPLKTVKPFVIRVDNTTGVVDLVPEHEAKASEEELVTRYFLAHYVIIHERYFYAMAESDYQEVGALQSPRLNQEWMELWSANNPQSPINLYKDGTTIRVQVKSVSFFQRANGLRDLGQVRFIRFTRAGGTGPEQATHWIATIQYAYVKPSEDVKARTSNPLGFRVVEYRREPEVALETSQPDALHGEGR